MTLHPGNLAGLPPMGLKGEKKPKAKRQPLRKISRKKARYLASAERRDAEKHMAAVALLPCLVCGCWPVEVHHDHPSGPRDDTKVLPLCPRHHRREFGIGAYHYSPSAFYAAHGSHEDLLRRVTKLLAAQEADCLGEWF